MILKLNIVFLIVALCHGYPQQLSNIKKSFSDSAPSNPNLDQLAEPSEPLAQTIHKADDQIQDGNSDTMLLEPDHSETTGSSVHAMYPAAVEPHVDSQRFFPLFSIYNTNNGNPPSGHSRPFVFNQEGAYSHRPYSARQNLNSFDNGFRGESFDDEFDHTSGIKPIIRDSPSAGLLGSGNFGVIRGGTFYNENDDISEFAGSNHHLFNPYYQNGHGRPASYYINPKPTKHEQFANFRDFADINTPSNSAYSQYVIVYANKNSTRQDMNTQKLLAINFKPKNINERLEMLDNEEDLSLSISAETVTDAPQLKKKLSKSKQKLSLLLPEKKPWGKKFDKKNINSLSSSSTTTTDKSTDLLYEPLLALS
ncbi:uncharacterized protein LOC123298149 [Chrysoperla carnea]|uniref:uncharacterized protein LOC123298149 n=1 Tax=Chrysoperla carnea TaxID=189513 RepID=UPI001D07A3D8|nr:uncharacterized protein LOC123298149 [Chrysoperla carnea]